MTVISTTHAAVLAKIAATLPNAKRIANAYEPEVSALGVLTNGYGLALGPGEDTREEIACRLGMARTIAVMLTRLCAAADSQTAGRDAAELALLEDQLLLIKAFDQDNQLGGAVSDIRYVNDGGIEFLVTDNAMGKFYVLTSIFAVKYTESLSS